MLNVDVTSSSSCGSVMSGSSVFALLAVLRRSRGASCGSGSSPGSHRTADSLPPSSGSSGRSHVRRPVGHRTYGGRDSPCFSVMITVKLWLTWVGSDQKRPLLAGRPSARAGAPAWAFHRGVNSRRGRGRAGRAWPPRPRGHPHVHGVCASPAAGERLGGNEQGLPRSTLSPRNWRILTTLSGLLPS